MYLHSRSQPHALELSAGSTTIGRRRDCDIVLSSDLVSKQHVEIQVAGRRVQVRDCDSHNHSFLNDRDIAGLGWVAVRAGDRLSLCNFEFEFRDRLDPQESDGACIFVTDEGTGSILHSQSVSLSKRSRRELKSGSQLQALVEMASSLRDVLKTEEVMQRAVQLLFKIFPSVDRAAIGLVEDGELIPKWWQLRQGDSQSVICMSKTLVDRVLNSGEAILCSDAAVDFSNAHSVHANFVHSVMCAPLMDAKETAAGVIQVDSQRSGQFASADLDIFAAISTQLSLAINYSRMHAQAVEDALLRRDVESARAVQSRYIPTATPSIPGYDLCGFYRAARHVGGDYFDYIELADGRLAIVLGDVVGKGVPAALTMVRLATETRASFEVCSTAGQVLTRLNSRFQDDFITVAALILDPHTHTLTLSNAGHERPLLRTIGGQVNELGEQKAGYPLSVREEYQYQEFTWQVAPGDRVVIYSDGFPDAEHRPTQSRFGKQRIVDVLVKCGGSSQDFINLLIQQADDFMDGSTQFDDMCLVCLRRE